MSLFILKPLKFYDEQITIQINAYMNFYKYVSGFFYYLKTRIYISKLPLGDWLNYRDNWSSINKSQLVIWFLRDRTDEESFQYYEKNIYTPSLSIFYLPFNFISRGVVFTDNCALTPSADGQTVKIFSLGKKIVSTINEALPANAYVNPSPTSGYTKEGVKWPVKYANNNELLVAKSSEYNIETPYNFDQIVIFPNGPIEKLVLREYPPSTSYNNNNFQYSIFANVQFFSLECVRYCLNYSPNSKFQVYDRDLNGFRNILVAQSAIIGNNTLSYLGGKDLILDESYQNYLVITSNDLTMGELKLINDTTLVSVPSFEFAYYVCYNGFQSNSLNPNLYSSSNQSATTQAQFIVNDYFQSSIPTVVYTFANNKWSEVSLSSLNNFEYVAYDLIVFQFKKINFKYANVPPNSLTHYSLFNASDNQNNTQQVTPQMQGQAFAILNISSISNGLFFGALDNLMVAKMITFNSIQFSNPNTINESGQINSLYNRTYANRYISQIFPEGTNISSYGVDDNSFSIGMRQFVKFYNHAEQLSLTFLCKISFTFELNINKFKYDSNRQWYVYSTNYSIPLNYGVFKSYSMHTCGNDTSDIILAATLGYTYRSLICPSFVSNKKNSFSFAQKVKNQQDFQILLSRIPQILNGDTLNCTLQLA
jgi:hypothetical protein